MVMFILFAFASITFSKVILEPPAEVKRFPFITYTKVWEGTPAESEDTAVPNVVITYGKGEPRSVVSVAVEIAYSLGQWTDDPGLSPRKVRKGSYPAIVLPIKKALSSGKPVILIGTNNAVVKSTPMTFRGPTLRVIEKDGRKILIVGGRNTKEVLRAGHFLARRIIGFKAGAYRTFFSFVRLRGMIEKENYESALELIKSPAGLSACGKNLSLMAPMVLKMPKDVKKVVKERNRLLYVQLSSAVREGDKNMALNAWKKAMRTCYQCHQGLGVPRLRKFIPNKEIHSKHQRIAKRWGLDCTACHQRITEVRGY